MNTEFIEKMGQIQAELKAPKGQFNKFGNYNYRSCEDILEAVKPLVIKAGYVLTITDDIICVGERYYIKATVKIDCGGESYEVSACAREALTRKGMDESQITGTASSYARKYALNGMFCIDDTKDDDNQNKKTGKKEKLEIAPEEITGEQKAEIYNLLKYLNIANVINLPSDDKDYIPVTEWLMEEKIVSVEKMKYKDAEKLRDFLFKKLNKERSKK